MAIYEWPGAEPVDASELPPEFSEDALAHEFTARHRGELRYCSDWGKWLRWDGRVWAFERTLYAFDRARAVACDFANACDKPATAKKLASAATVAAIERLARADRKHAATVGMWDTDPWLLNTPGGIVDLRDCTSVPHNPLWYITKITAVAPGGECPLWRKFQGNH